jgi:hypothetical protein
MEAGGDFFIEIDFSSTSAHNLWIWHKYIEN